METASLRVLKENVKNFFRQKNDYSMGIYINEEYIYCVKILFLANDDVQVAYANKFYIDKESGDENLAGTIAELMNLWQQDNIYDNNVTLCINEGNVYYYRKEFPDMKRKNIESAIHWDIASNEPFGDNYVEAFADMPENENLFLLGAVAKAEIEKFNSVLSTANINLLSVVSAVCQNIEYVAGDIYINDKIKCSVPYTWQELFIDSNMQYACYAAMSDLVTQGLVFTIGSQRMRGWDFFKLTAAVCITTFSLSAFGIGFSYYNLQKEKSGLTHISENFSLMSDVWSSKQRTDVTNRLIKDKIKLLQDLRKNSWPIYGILVHLGCNIGEGTWLTDISIDKEKNIILQGKALNYNNMVNYCNLLNNDKDFFTGGAILEKSNLNSDGKIDFSIRVSI